MQEVGTMQKKSRTFFKKIYLKPSLKEQLQQIMAVPLTVVTAPLGYGKTTAVKKVLLELSADIQWNNCAAGAETVFWHCFVQALHAVGVDTSSLASQELPRSATARQQVLEVLQTASLKKPVVFVWNDYHRLQSEACDQLLLELTRAELADWHFVLLTQRPLAFTLEDLVLKGTCLHLQAEDLAFGLNDIIIYYRKNGIVLERCEAKALLELTEGWISGLYCYLCQHQEGRPLAMGEELLGLLQAVADAPCESVERKLLLELALLEDDFTGRQAAYITENAAAAVLLEKLVLKHGFITYKLLDCTYHIHPSFKDYLRRCGNAEVTDNRRRQLYGNCGRWYQQERDYRRAFGYFHAAGDYDSMLTVFEKDRGCSFENSYQKKIMTYFEECPQKIRKKHINAGLIYGLWLFLSGENELLAEELVRLRSYIDVISDVGERCQCMGELEFLLGQTKYNDVAAIWLHLKKALQLVHQPIRFFSPQTIWGGGANSILFMFYRRQGTLQKTLDIFPEAMADYYKLVQNHGAGAEYVLAAEAYFMRGDWERGLILATEARNISRRNEQISVELAAGFVEMRINAALGNKKQLRICSAYFDRMLAELHEHLYRKTIEACRAWIDLQLGDKGRAIVPWLQRGEFQESGLLYSAWGCLYIIYGHYLLLQKEYVQLLGYLREFNEAAQRFNNFLLSIYAAIYSAAAQHGLGNEQAARSELRRALELSAEDGIVMPFVENFALLRELLEQEPEHMELLGRILELGKCYQSNIKKVKHKAVYTGDKALTAREAEIIGFVIKGMTNAEIAEEMFMAEITVKKALQGIYRKLGVDTRLELVMVLNSDQ